MKNRKGIQMTEPPIEWRSGDHNRKANICLMHQYLYYCLAEQIISDTEYDILEKQAIEEADEDHPLAVYPGSSMPQHYSRRIKSMATQVLRDHKEGNPND